MTGRRSGAFDRKSSPPLHCPSTQQSSAQTSTGCKESIKEKSMTMKHPMDLHTVPESSSDQRAQCLFSFTSRPRNIHTDEKEQQIPGSQSIGGMQRRQLLQDHPSQEGSERNPMPQGIDQQHRLGLEGGRGIYIVSYPFSSSLRADSHSIG